MQAEGQVLEALPQQAFLYPFARERELRKRILAGDRSGALQALAGLLRALQPDRLPEAEAVDLARLRSDALHLAVVLIRKTYQAGAPVGPMLASVMDLARQLSESRSVLDVQRVLEQVVLGLVEQVRAARQSGSQEALERALVYVQSHYTKNLSLEEVAAVVNLSYWYLSRLFTRLVGVSFQEYVTGLRLAAAKELLLETRLTVEEVARQVGYEDASHFTRIFKQRTGMTPRAFARAHGEEGIGGLPLRSAPPARAAG